MSEIEKILEVINVKAENTTMGMTGVAHGDRGGEGMAVKKAGDWALQELGTL